MSTAFLAGVAALVLFTSFVSGIFGMAGGMILMGVLLLMMPVTSAMALHAAVQLASNGWRAVLWRTHTEWRIVGRFALGALAALLLFLAVNFVPSERVVLLILGVSPFIALALPARYAIQAEARGGAQVCGFVCQSLQMLSGVTGPVLDLFFVRSTTMDRRKVIATKATCQVIGHGMRLTYFGVLMSSKLLMLPMWQWALLIFGSIVGTSLSRSVLERISNAQFRNWTRGIVLAVGTVYLVQGIASFF